MLPSAPNRGFTVTPLFTWLHLSDIHACRDKAALDRVLAELRAEQGLHGKVNAIFVTGDIAFAGGVDPNEYKAATAWLTELTSIVGCKLTDVYTVPGNHDVARIDPSDRASRRLFNEIRDGDGVIRRLPERFDAALDHPADRALIVARWNRYSEFTSQLAPCMARNSSACGLVWSHKLRVNDVNVRLIGLNTAALANDDADKTRLAIGRGALDMVVDTAQNAALMQEIVLLLSHHSFGWLENNEETQATNHLYHGQLVHAHLTGHVEPRDVMSVQEGLTVRIAAGRLRERRPSNDTGGAFSFSVGAVAADASGRIRMRVRQFQNGEVSLTSSKTNPFASVRWLVQGIDVQPTVLPSAPNAIAHPTSLSAAIRIPEVPPSLPPTVRVDYNAPTMPQQRIQLILEPDTDDTAKLNFADELPSTADIPPTQPSPKEQAKRFRPKDLPRQVLRVHILWEGSSRLALNLANDIYRHVARDPRQPLLRTPGVPVYFFASHTAPGADVTAKTDDSADCCLTIPIVDQAMLSNAAWREHLRKLHDHATTNTSRAVLPVVLNGCSLPAETAMFNRTIEHAEPEIEKIGQDHAAALKRTEAQQASLWRLLFEIDHALCRMLYENPAQGLNPAGINLVSFAGNPRAEALAEAFKQYVERELPVRVLRHTQDNSSADTIVVFRTDDFGALTDARRFIMNMKRSNRPMVVLDALESRDSRSSPYLGNLPTIRWMQGAKEDRQYQHLATLAMQESLRNAYFQRLVLALNNALRAPVGAQVLPREPEVTSCLDVRPHGTVIYPEPPIADDEIDVLDQHFHGKIVFLTPTQLPSIPRRALP